MHRAALLNYLEVAIKIATKKQKRSEKQLDLFADYYSGESNIELEFLESICPKWDNHELLLAEKEALGFYFSDHPLVEFQKELTTMGIIKFNQATLEKKPQKFAGCIVAIRLTRTKRGDKMAFVTLDDSVARQEIVVFSDLYEQNKELLKKDQLIVIEGEASKDDYTGGFKIKCNKITNFSDIFKTIANNVTIVLNQWIDDANVVAEKIKKIIMPYPGNCPLIMHYQKSGMLTKIKFGINWAVSPEKQLLTDLKKLAEIDDAFVN